MKTVRTKYLLSSNANYCIADLYILKLQTIYSLSYKFWSYKASLHSSTVLSAPSFSHPQNKYCCNQHANRTLNIINKVIHHHHHTTHTYECGPSHSSMAVPLRAEHCGFELGNSLSTNKVGIRLHTPNPTQTPESLVHWCAVIYIYIYMMLRSYEDKCSAWCCYHCILSFPYPNPRKYFGHNNSLQYQEQ